MTNPGTDPVEGPQPQRQTDDSQTPRSQNWGKIMPRIIGTVVAVAVVATGAILLAANHTKTANDPSHNEAVETAAPTNVVTAPAQRVTFVRSINVQGNVQAKNLSLVSPRLKGVINTVMVDEGDRVEAGVTKLFQTDPVKLAKAVEVSEQAVNVAEQSLCEKKASLEKTKADYDKAEYDWRRYQKLFAEGSSSNDEHEEAETEFKRCAAMLKHAEALVSLADAQLMQAQSSLGIAQKELDDSLVLSPITGLVTQRFQEPGESGEPGKPVMRIEDPSLLEVSVFLPARAYGEVIPNETRMLVVANGIDLGEHVVTYKSPTISSDLRTFEARCLLHDPPSSVAAGSMAHVQVVVEKHDSLGVPRDAIQRRSGGPVVFVADNGLAQMVPVTTGLEMDGLVEIKSEGISEGSSIITLGAYFLDENAEIKLWKEGR